MILGMIGDCELKTRDTFDTLLDIIVYFKVICLSYLEDGPPVSKWFVTHLGHLEGEYPQLGDLLTMVISHLLNGMILQVRGKYTNRTCFSTVPSRES